MDWRRRTRTVAGGALVTVGLLSVTAAALGVSATALTGSSTTLLGSPAPERTVDLVLTFVVVVAGLTPVFAAGVGVSAGRYGVLGCLLGTLYALAGPATTYATTRALSSAGAGVPVWQRPRVLLVGAGLLVWLALWPLSAAVGYVEYARRREPDDGRLARAGHLLQGPLLPVAVVAGVWTWWRTGMDGLVPLPVVVAAPFVAVAAARRLARERSEPSRVGDLSPAEGALWTLGTRPLFAASVGVVGLFAATAAASLLGLLSGPVFRAAPSPSGSVLTPVRVLVAASLPPALGGVYVVTTAGDLLSGWREFVAVRRREHADGPDDVPGVTVLSVEDRLARVGPPRTVRAEHLLLGEDRLRVVEDARLDLATRTAERVGEARALDAAAPLAARRNDRVHVETADGDWERTPVGDAERVLAAVERRYGRGREAGGRKTGRGRTTDARRTATGGRGHADADPGRGD
ncbi:hypothetical protein BRD18_09115 [Halobacteriales archaeon SW_7_71_33]|nr:MAG: hypothetical protein BRD18_09115 [Halobacteriales archaeon SW_7_71_33]